METPNCPSCHTVLVPSITRKGALECLLCGKIVSITDTNGFVQISVEEPELEECAA